MPIKPENRSRYPALASLVEQLHDKKAPTNVAQVRQLSPFRYPGGKTWLVPEVRKWLTAFRPSPPRPVSAARAAS